MKEWHRWDASHESENDPVDAFPDDQLYVVFVFADGGVDLEHFELRSFQEAQSVLLQASTLDYGCLGMRLQVPGCAWQCEHSKARCCRHVSHK